MCGCWPEEPGSKAKTEPNVGFLSPEPNNESPLNTAAAELWENQEGETLQTRSTLSTV